MSLRPVSDGAASRMTLGILAWAYGLAGLVVVMWASARLPADMAGGKARALSLGGGVILAVACVAWGMARVPDSRIQRDLLRWFGLGHGVFLSVASVWQLRLSGHEHPLGESAIYLLASVALVLLLSSRRPPEKVELTTLFGGRRVPVADLRTTYEQNIRDAAGLEERHRLARDLHDSIKQQVFVIQTAAAAAQARFDDDPDGARSALEQVRTAGREAMAEMNAMVDQLRSSAMENTGLVEALKRHCEALGFRTGAEVTFEAGSLPPSESLPPGAHQAILRVAQEALANVGQHARARHVWVRLEADANAVILAVRDDGVGFEALRPAAGIGLGNMSARAKDCGGTLDVSTSAGQGTTVRVNVPHAAGADVVESRRLVVRWTLGYAAALVLVFALRDVVSPLAGLPAATVTGIYLARAVVNYRRARRFMNWMPWAQPPSPSSTTTG